MVSPWCLCLVLFVLYSLPLPYGLFFHWPLSYTSGFNFLIAAAYIPAADATPVPDRYLGSVLILVPSCVFPTNSFMHFSACPDCSDLLEYFLGLILFSCFLLCSSSHQTTPLQRSTSHRCLLKYLCLPALHSGVSH